MKSNGVSSPGFARQDQDSRDRSRRQAGLVQGEGLPTEQGMVNLNSAPRVRYLNTVSVHHLCDTSTLTYFRQVPSLEHNNEVKGESLDLVKYIDSNFDGPALLPDVNILYF